MKPYTVSFIHKGRALTFKVSAANEGAARAACYAYHEGSMITITGVAITPQQPLMQD